MRLKGMPIVAATRSIVSRASAGCFAHHSSILAKLSLRTFLFGSEMGSSLSHLLKARTAREVGLCCASHGLTVVLATNREDGSKLGGAGGAGLWELRRRAAWIGGGLEAEGPVVFGLDGSPGVSPSCWRSWASWLRSWVNSCWVSGSAARVGTQLWMRSATCWAAYLVLFVLSSNFPSCLALQEATLSMSTPLLRSWVKSSVVNTTAAMSPVGIK